MLFANIDEIIDGTSKYRTVADRIRSMTDEELATMFAHYEYNVAAVILKYAGIDFPREDADFEGSAKEIIRKLQQPVEE